MFALSEVTNLYFHLYYWEIITRFTLLILRLTLITPHFTEDNNLETGLVMSIVSRRWLRQRSLCLVGGPGLRARFTLGSTISDIKNIHRIN